MSMSPRGSRVWAWVQVAWARVAAAAAGCQLRRKPSSAAFTWPAWVRSASPWRGSCRPGHSLIGFIAGISVEARHLVVDDPPAVGLLADDHTEVHGEGGAVAETEVDSEVAEYQTIAQRAGFAERVHRGHAHRLGGAVLGDARRPHGVGMQALKDRGRCEQRGHVFPLAAPDPPP